MTWTLSSSDSSSPPARRRLRAVQPIDDLEARILLESDGILAVDKCPDLPSSGRTLADEDCLQFALMQRQGAMVWAVHQLDADTSGVNLFVTRKELVEPLKQAMGHPEATKRYLAVVHGSPSWTEQTCSAPIGSIGKGMLGVSPQGRHASSTFEVLARKNGHAVIAATIATGRTHQIRIHLASLGHSLVGEEWYREEPCELHPRQALHASRLRVEGPHGLDVTAPLPRDLQDLMARLGLSPQDESVAL